MILKVIRLFVLLFCLMACSRQKQAEVTPWGEVLTESGDTVATDCSFTMSDMLASGEMIMLTLSGPDTYFDYHGRGMGTQYLLCEMFAQELGVKLRVEVCKDTAEMVSRLLDGEADVIACQLHRGDARLAYCGYGVDSLRTSWAVRADNSELADTLARWYSPTLYAKVKQGERQLFATGTVNRKVYSPMLNPSGGVISRYDHLFRRYAPQVRWDWRLLAAQCYQESTFDSCARSWAGARGLMQIMPATAQLVGLAAEDIEDPEKNIAAATRYIARLDRKFSDVRSTAERRWFVLAAYNGGFFHIRDAMALARKHGKSSYRWADVSEFVLKLRQPQYYNDPVVKYGYMRGDETADYVDRIRRRWSYYGGRAVGNGIGAGPGSTPQKASKKHRFQL